MEEIKIDPEDTKELEPIKVVPVKKEKPDVEVEVRYRGDVEGGALVKGPNGEQRIVPSEHKVHRTYPTKFKESLWKSFKLK